jgi:peptide/nickel transport system substrate-binding protein
LWYAIDRDAINKAIFNGKKAITDLPLPKGLSWAYPPDSEITTYAYNLDKAKQLLKDAGWDCSTNPCTKKDKDGKTVKLEFTFMTTDRQSRIDASQIIMNNWKKLNVGVNVQYLYGRGLFAVCSASGPLYCRTFDAAMYTFSTLDDATFYQLYACSAIPSKDNNWSGQNNPGWCNQKAVNALNNSENNPDVALSQEKRKPYLTTFFKEFTNDVPVIVLYGSSEPFPHRVGWKNFKAGPTSQSLFTWNSWEWEVSK